VLRIGRLSNAGSSRTSKLAVIGELEKGMDIESEAGDNRAPETGAPPPLL
jgi:hypothetical protein